MRCFWVAVLVLCVFTAGAQDKVFETDKTHEPRHGFIITGNTNLDFPAGDIGKMFGTSYRVGFGLLHKSKKNWLLGAKFDFILGNIIHIDSFMINIRDQYNTGFNAKYVELINAGGNRVGIPIYERGYATGIEAGKIININPLRPDNGIMLLTTAGFMQYKVDIFDADNAVPAIRGDYKKGYDRLTNGLFLEQYAGYVYFSKSRLINFHIGLDALFGFTQDRRSYLYDVMRTDTKQRVDILYGLRGGWYIPMFRRKSEDILFN
jgi:hypothetical protein